MQPLVQKPQWKMDGNLQQQPNNNNFSKLYYRCSAEGHLAQNYTTALSIPHVHIPDTRDARKDSLATYIMGVVKIVIPKAREVVDAYIDDCLLINDEDDSIMPLLLYHLLA